MDINQIIKDAIDLSTLNHEIIILVIPGARYADLHAAIVSAWDYGYADGWDREDAAWNGEWDAHDDGVLDAWSNGTNKWRIFIETES